MCRLDNRMRFRKALEVAPLFCRDHESLIAADGLPENFAQVQRTKLQHLRDALAQTALLNREGLESLISSTLAFLGRPEVEQPSSQAQESNESGEHESSEFERWDLEPTQTS
jgi:hypothetical protein